MVVPWGCCCNSQLLHEVLDCGTSTCLSSASSSTVYTRPYPHFTTFFITNSSLPYRSFSTKLPSEPPSLHPCLLPTSSISSMPLPDLPSPNPPCLSSTTPSRWISLSSLSASFFSLLFLLYNSHFLYLLPLSIFFCGTDPWTNVNVGFWFFWLLVFS